MTLLFLILTILYWFFLIFISLSAVFFLAIQLKKEEISSPNVTPKGRVLVMIPCKGIDLTLNETLQSIKNQDYAAYSSVCIVDSLDDPAVPIIREAGLELIVSDDKCVACSGKVKALCTAMKQFPDYDFYAIADSDIVVGKKWLTSLMLELNNNMVGLSTTFPIFISNRKFWSLVKSVWGMVGLSMMKSDRTRFGWGGSLVFRRDLTEGYIDVFCNSISDDVALSKICKKKGLILRYVGEASPRIQVDESRKTFMEWANRQVALSVSSGGGVLSFGLAYFIAQCLLIISSILLVFLVNPLFMLLLAPFLTQSLRYRAAHGFLPFPVILIEFLLPFIYAYNLVHAALNKNIEWRGGKYTLNRFRDL